MKHSHYTARSLFAALCVVGSTHCSQGPTGSSQTAAPPMSLPTGVRVQSNGQPGGPARVATPAGLLEARCVHQLPEGVTVDHEFNTYENGQITGRFDLCESSGAPAIPGRTPNAPLPGPPAIPPVNWVESAAAYATNIGGVSFYTKMTAQFGVPSPPTSPNDGEAIYLFPSFTSNREIIQPVLRYYNQAWSLAAWYVLDGNGVSSTPIAVSTGDALTASMTLIDGSQPTFDVWQIVATDTKTNATTQKNFNTTKGSFNGVQGGVLESYAFVGGLWVDGVPNCTDYPASNEFFGSLAVQQANGRWNNPTTVTPTWANCINGVTAPGNATCQAQAQNCGFGMATGPTGTTLAY